MPKKALTPDEFQEIIKGSKAQIVGEPLAIAPTPYDVPWQEKWWQVAKAALKHWPYGGGDEHLTAVADVPLFERPEALLRQVAEHGDAYLKVVLPLLTMMAESADPTDMAGSVAGTLQELIERLILVRKYVAMEGTKQ